MPDITSSQKITPFLWFDTQAEEAVNFYVSVFPDSKVVSESRYGPEGPGPEGSVMVMNYQLCGQDFIALNGGPMYPFTNAVSFMVTCEDQKEVDHYWSKLSDGGNEIQCGWLNDRYGLPWQIVPQVFFKLIQDPDRERVSRVMSAMFGMVKFDVEGLLRAYEGK